MDPADFGPDATGELVAVTARDPNVTHAFVPCPLREMEESWRWPDRLWPILVDAREELARLDGAGRYLPDPRLVLRPLERREAQLSSRLEGTYTDPRQQLLFEVEDYDLEGSPTNDPRREVANYVRALRLRKGGLGELPLSLRLVRELHRVLMTGVRGEERDPGSFRGLQSQIGRPPRFVPPPAHLVPDLLHDLERFLHGEAFDPLVRAFIAHYQFEAIHPFMDGNGRVGRLLLAITIEEWCGLSEQWLFMSEYFERNRDAYLDRLFRVSVDGDWEGWLEFCLRGVVEQARTTTAMLDRLIALRDEYQSRVQEAGGPGRLARLVDDLFVLPVVRVTGAAERVEVTYPTARRDLKRLEELGVLVAVPDAEQITYASPGIIEVVYGE